MRSSLPAVLSAVALAKAEARGAKAGLARSRGFRLQFPQQRGADAAVAVGGQERNIDDADFFACAHSERVPRALRPVSFVGR
jgi:hypothetical protein